LEWDEFGFTGVEMDRGEVLVEKGFEADDFVVWLQMSAQCCVGTYTIRSAREPSSSVQIEGRRLTSIGSGGNDDLFIRQFPSLPGQILKR
jgi:hypothetical protein